MGTYYSIYWVPTIYWAPTILFKALGAQQRTRWGKGVSCFYRTYILVPGRQVLKCVNKIISNHGEGDGGNKPSEVTEWQWVREGFSEEGPGSCDLNGKKEAVVWNAWGGLWGIERGRRSWSQRISGSARKGGAGVGGAGDSGRSEKRVTIVRDSVGQGPFWPRLIPGVTVLLCV